MSEQNPAGVPLQQQQYQQTYQYQAPVQYYVPVQYPYAQVYQQQVFKGGFHPIYAWSIACLALTYGYILLFAISNNFLRSFSGTENSKFPLLYFMLPLALSIANTVISVTWGRRIDRRYLLGAALILKYGLIPYFVVGGMLIAIFFLLIFTPVVIMIFVSPPIIIVLSVIGWVTLTESAPFMVAYFVRSAREAALSGGKVRKTGNIVFCVFGCVMQMFFCLDVAAAVIACFKEKRHVKLTICVLAAPVVIFGIFMAVIIGIGLVKRNGG